MNKKEMKKYRVTMQKPWWNYVILTAAILLFNSGCYQLNSTDDLTLPISVIFFSIILHSPCLRYFSEKHLFTIINMKSNDKISNEENKNIKEKSHLVANIIMFIILTLIAILYNLNYFSLIYVLLYDIFSIVIYCIISIMIYKMYRKRKF